MTIEFYLVTEKHATITGGEVVLPNVLFFRQDAAGFDGKATKEHVANYAGPYGEFKSKNPDYVPTLEEPVEIGSPVVKIGEPQIEGKPPQDNGKPTLENQPVVPVPEEAKANEPAPEVA